MNYFALAGLHFGLHCKNHSLLTFLQESEPCKYIYSPAISVAESDQELQIISAKVTNLGRGRKLGYFTLIITENLYLKVFTYEELEYLIRI